MEKSSVFALIKKMPKGAILHIHKSAMASLEFIIGDLTYMDPDHLYVCDTDTSIEFRFSDGPPDRECADQWSLVSQQRAAAASPLAFDYYLQQRMSLITEDPRGTYPDINAVWDAFEGYFDAVGGLINYRSAFQRYLWRALEEAVQDGVSYLEFKGTLSQLYELDGSKISLEETVRC